MPSLFRKVSPLKEYNLINFSCLQFVNFQRLFFYLEIQNIYNKRKTCSLTS